MSNIDWSEMTRFEDDPASTTLWVVFLPEQVNAEGVKMQDMLRRVPGKKLYVSFVNRETYNTHDPDTHRRKVDTPMAVVEEIRSKYKIDRTIAWGYSRGAYFALLFGCLQRYDRIVAISPELVIGEPHSRSAKLISNPYAPYANLIPLIDAFKGEGIDIIVPCYSPREAINVKFAQTIQNPLCEVHYFPGGHFIQRRMEQEPWIHDIISSVSRGLRFFLPSAWVAAPVEVEVAKASFDLAVLIDTKARALPPVNDHGSRNHEWFFLKSKMLNRCGKLDSAIAAAVHSVELNPKIVAHLVHLAQLYLKAKDLDRARSVCEQAMQLSGDLVTVRKTMALIEQAANSGNLEEASTAASAEEEKWTLKSGQPD